jgi:hypothetical protein
LAGIDGGFMFKAGGEIITSATAAERVMNQPGAEVFARISPEQTQRLLYAVRLEELADKTAPQLLASLKQELGENFQPAYNALKNKENGVLINIDSDNPTGELIRGGSNGSEELISIKNRLSRLNFDRQIIDDLSANKLSWLNQLNDEELGNLQKALQSIEPGEASGYLYAIAVNDLSEMRKGVRLLKFRNFGNSAYFENVLYAVDLDDIAKMEVIYDSNNLSLLDNAKRKRYEQLLQEIANGTFYSDISFKERLAVLEDVNSIRKDLNQRLTNQVYRQNKIKIDTRNIAYGNYNITLPNGSTLSDDFVSLSGENVSTQITGRLGNLLENKTIVPEVSSSRIERFEAIRGGGEHDSERKATEYIVELIEQRSEIGIDEVDVLSDSLVPPYEGMGFSGTININSEMSPCFSCAQIMEEQFQKLFGDDIQMNIRFGADFE